MSLRAPPATDGGVNRTDAVAQLRALHAITRASSEASNHDDLLRWTASAAQRALQAASVSIERFEREHGVLRTLVSVGDLGPTERELPEHETYAINEYATLEFLESGRRVPSPASRIQKPIPASSSCCASSASTARSTCRSSSTGPCGVSCSQPASRTWSPSPTATSTSPRRWQRRSRPASPRARTPAGWRCWPDWIRLRVWPTAAPSRSGWTEPSTRTRSGVARCRWRCVTSTPSSRSTTSSATMRATGC